jgi:hypothetical protein
MTKMPRKRLSAMNDDRMAAMITHPRGVQEVAGGEELVSERRVFLDVPVCKSHPSWVDVSLGESQRSV